MTATEIQNLVDDPEAEELERPEIGTRDIDDLCDDPVDPSKQIDLDDELLGDQEEE